MRASIYNKTNTDINTKSQVPRVRTKLLAIQFAYGKAPLRAPSSAIIIIITAISLITAIIITATTTGTATTTTKMRRDEARRDERDETRRDKTRRDETRRDETRQDEAYACTYSIFELCIDYNWCVHNASLYMLYIANIEF